MICQKICTLYFRRLLNFDFVQNSCTEFHGHLTEGLDAHTRSWPGIKQRDTSIALCSHEQCHILSTVGLYGFKNTTNKHKYKIIHTIKEYAVHTA